MNTKKRIIAHFIQPHTPYITEWARENIGVGTGDQPAYKRALGSEIDSNSWEIELHLLEDAHGKHIVGESEHSSNDLFESFVTGVT